MGTLTIRRIDNDVLAKFKEIAKRNNRSAEAEARSLLEEITAEYAARKIMTSADLISEMHQLLEDDGCDDDEDFVPPRNTYDREPRPVDLGDDDDHS